MESAALDAQMQEYAASLAAREAATAAALAGPADSAPSPSSTSTPTLQSPAKDANHSDAQAEHPRTATPQPSLAAPLSRMASQLSPLAASPAPQLPPGAGPLQMTNTQVELAQEIGTFMSASREGGEQARLTACHSICGSTAALAWRGQSTVAIVASITSQRTIQ